MNTSESKTADFATNITYMKLICYSNAVRAFESNSLIVLSKCEYVTCFSVEVAAFTSSEVCSDQTEAVVQWRDHSWHL